MAGNTRPSKTLRAGAMGVKVSVVYRQPRDFVVNSGYNSCSVGPGASARWSCGVD